MLYHIRTLAVVALMAYTLWAWWRIPTPRRPVFQAFGGLAWLALLLELAGYGTTLAKMNNSWMYNLFIPLELWLVARMVVASAMRLRPLAWTCATIGTVAMVAVAYWSDPRAFMLIEGILICALMASVMLIAALFNMAARSETPLQRDPAFWLLMGMLPYFAGLLPTIGMAHLLFAEDRDLVHTLWSIIPGLAFLRYLITAYACRMEAGPAT